MVAADPSLAPARRAVRVGLRVGVRLASALAIAMALPALATPAAPRQQRPQQAVPPVQLETRVDLILVDVNVVDREGRPVEGLAVADFRVFVDGRPRRIHSVQFVGQAAPPAEAEPAPLPHVSTNSRSGLGRLYLLVIDDSALSISDTHALVEPLEAFFAGLSPRDRVGLVTIPRGGPRVDFTSDLARVRAAVARVTGMPTLLTSLSPYSVGTAEALLFEARSSEWNAVIARECARARGDEARTCPKDVEAEARARLTDIHYRAGGALGALQDVIRSLRSIAGPKIVVLVSGGLILERQDLHSQLVGEEAAAANSTVYVLHLERPLTDASVARPSPTFYEDLALGRTGLEMVAGRARGEVFSVPVSAESALARIATESSGYYLIGVEADPDDRDGKAHPVRVELASARRGLTLRSRREFRHDRDGERAEADEDRLGGLIGAPGTVDEVPIRATSFSLSEPGGSRRRVLVAAEFDDPEPGTRPVVVGYTVTDGVGREVAKRGERVTLAPAQAGKTSPLRYASAVSLDPGDYVLKLGVILADGRRGSVEHAFALQPTPAGPVRLGDLFVLDVPETGSADLRAEVLARVAGWRVAFYAEVFASEADAFDRTELLLEVRSLGDGTLRIRAPVQAGGPDAARRVVQVAMSTADLDPGDYVARLTATGPDGATGFVERPFRIVVRKR